MATLTEEETAEPAEIAPTPSAGERSEVETTQVPSSTLPDEHEAMEMIQAAERMAAEAERDMDGRKEDYADAKKRYEVALEELRSVIRWARTPQVPPAPTLFDGLAEPSANG